MNCVDCEQLFDAYLDGQLAGSLRLEFDAHRLRCTRCQQQLALLESLGSVLATDSEVPVLSGDFTDRVMAHVQRPRRFLRLPLRTTVVSAAIVQAAAVLGFAVLWNRPGGSPAQSGAGASTRITDVVSLEQAVDPEYQAIHELIVRGVEEYVYDMHAAGQKVTMDLANLARYLNIALPEDVARETTRFSTADPWQLLWGPLQPQQAPEPAPPTGGDQLISL
ncbi:MAG: hypothetical protein IPM18_01465 [Phycisphaerales bacterium]|nr:hypothetical protein [Phycisphaerales bacterium]